MKYMSELEAFAFEIHWNTSLEHGEIIETPKILNDWNMPHITWRNFRVENGNNRGRSTRRKFIITWWEIMNGMRNRIGGAYGKSVNAFFLLISTSLIYVSLSQHPSSIITSALTIHPLGLQSFESFAVFMHALHDSIFRVKPFHSSSDAR